MTTQLRCIYYHPSVSPIPSDYHLPTWPYSLTGIVSSFSYTRGDVLMIWKEFVCIYISDRFRWYWLDIFGIRQYNLLVGVIMKSSCVIAVSHIYMWCQLRCAYIISNWNYVSRPMLIEFTCVSMNMNIICKHRTSRADTQIFSGGSRSVTHPFANEKCTRKFYHMLPNWLVSLLFYYRCG